MALEDCCSSGSVMKDAMPGPDDGVADQAADHALHIDAPVKLVGVHGVDPVLEAPVFSLELRHCFSMELLLVPVAFTQGRR